MSKNTWCSMHLGKDVCVSWKDLFLSIRRLYLIWCLREIYKESVTIIFLGTHTVQTVPKYIWMRHWPWFTCGLNLLRESVTPSESKSVSANTRKFKRWTFFFCSRLLRKTLLILRLICFQGLDQFWIEKMILSWSVLIKA